MPLIHQPEHELDLGYIELPSGLIVPEDLAPAKRPKCVDLFCGAGGSSLGIIQAGFEVVAASDWDTTCAITYTVNLGAYPCQFWWVEPEDEKRMEKALQKDMGIAVNREPGRGIKDVAVCGSGWIAHAPAGTPGVRNFILGDIRKVTGEMILNIIGMEPGQLDCLVGTPPCQGYSFAGKQNVMDPRNSLVFEFARLICEIQPKTLIFENVPGILHMVTSEGYPVVDQFIRILEDGGFSTVNSLRKSIEAQVGSVGLLRHKPRNSRKEGDAEAETERKPIKRQMSKRKARPDVLGTWLRA